MTLLRVENLSVAYRVAAALRDVTLEIAPGEAVALVGASGSGKSTLALAIPGLLPADARVNGQVLLDGQPVGPADRGQRIGVIFQDPAIALNPARTIGWQVAAALGRRAARGDVARLFARVGLDIDPRRYPHMLSGGQRQRVAIAIGIARGPALLIADEPTAALDPAAAAAIATLLESLVAAGQAMLLVTHDLALARRLGHRLAVLDRGVLVEEGATDRIDRPASPALRALAAASSLPVAETPSPGDELLAMTDVTRRYGRRGAGVFDIGLALRAGETLALIGASGAGKSTIARLALGLDRPDAGSVRLGGVDPARARGEALHAVRRLAQAVFQDPATSFDPRWTVARLVADPLRLETEAGDRDARVAAALTAAEFDPALASRRPAELSGGQRQRVALARALIVGPRLVVLDEALSALDLATRAAIVALLRRLQAERGLAYLLVSHDPATIRALAHRVAIVEDGRIVREGETQAMLAG